MAGMTLVATKTGKINGQSDTAVWIGKGTFDSAYLSGGELLTNEMLGLTTLYSVQVTPDFLTSTTALVVGYDWSAATLIVFESGADGAALDVIGADDISALVVDIFAIGKG